MTPKNKGSIPKSSSKGRKIGTKMMMISVHSSGQPSRKMIACASSMKPSEFRPRLSTNCSTYPCPPSSANVEEKMADPTNSQHTMAAVRAVRKTDSLSFSNVKAF